MLTPDDRYYKWEEFKELIEKLFSKVEDELCFTYAHYGKEKDKDTPFVENLFFDAFRLVKFAEQHSIVLSKQLDEWEDETHLDEALSDALSWQFPCLHEVGGVLFV